MGMAALAVGGCPLNGPEPAATPLAIGQTITHPQTNGQTVESAIDILTVQVK